MANKYRHSFSGSDARPYAYFDGQEHVTVQLESLHTISYSVHEAKGQVRSLGYRGIRGMTRAVRTIAGSMIFLVIDDHPLRQLVANSFLAFGESAGWSVDKYMVGQGTAFDTYSFENRLPALMSPFNLLLTYVSELGDYSMTEGGELNDSLSALQSAEPVFLPPRAVVKGAATLIQGIEFIDEGTVTSVNDIVSEVTYSFIARDIKPLSLQQFTVGGPVVRANPNATAEAQAILKDTLFGSNTRFEGPNGTQTAVENAEYNEMQSLEMTPEEYADYKAGIY